MKSSVRLSKQLFDGVISGRDLADLRERVGLDAIVNAGSHGFDIIVEIARFWASLATLNADLGRYEILGVMGPDEYHDAYPGAETPSLNNNAYTNLMAVWVLCRALDLIQMLPSEHCSRVRQKLDVQDEEILRWDDISRKTRLVFHDDGILSQFEGYAGLTDSTGTSIARSMARPYGWTASWRPRATRPTATRPLNRPTS